MTQTAPTAVGADQPVTGTAPGPRGHHDWQSPEYVRAWVEQYEARAATRRPQFDLLADLVPRAREAPIRILDVGAGWGPLTLHLLTRFPAARSVLLDNSAPMFAEARERLAGVADRVSYVRGDLSQPSAIAAAGGPFDAVVSSLCVHNLRPAERIPALYGEICAAVAPDGCFLNLDLMGAAAPAVQEAWHRVRLEQLRRELLAETGTMPTPEEAEALLQAQSEGRRGGRDGARPAAAPAGSPPGAGGAGGLTRTLLDHLLWLRQAGFDAVDCFWRHDRQALIGGYRA
jgi:ubiquinone/menaquinone biosynthesis C-methylase UbiE